MSHLGRILVVSFRFPPQNVAGCIRAIKFVKYLARHGWNVDIMVPNGSTQEGFEEELKHSKISIIEVQCFKPFDLLLNIFKKFKRQSSMDKDTQDKASSQLSRCTTRKKSLFFQILLLLRFPDEAVFWRFHLLGAIRKYLRKFPDCKLIYTHGPPFSPFLAILSGNRSFKRKLIFDFRDPWSKDPEINYPFGFLKSWVQGWEKRILKSGYPLVTVTHQLAKQFQMLEPSSIGKFSVITNGFDPEDFPHEIPPSVSSQFIMAHAGNLFTRNTRYFLEGLQALVSQHPVLKPKLKVLFWGPKDLTTAQMIQDLALEQICEMRNPIPHSQLLKEISDISLFLLFQSYGPIDLVALPGKIFEYATLRRPILGFGWDGEAKRMIENSGWGKYFTESSANEEVANKIYEYYSLWEQHRLIPFGKDESLLLVSREHLTLKLEKLF